MFISFWELVGIRKPPTRPYQPPAPAKGPYLLSKTSIASHKSKMSLQPLGVVQKGHFTTFPILPLLRYYLKESSLFLYLDKGV